MNDIETLAARAALKKMAQNGWMDICTIDNILKMSGGVPNGQDYQVLRTLHCVNFRDMQPELLRGLPLLIKRVLESDGVDFSFAVTGSNNGELQFLEATHVRRIR